MHLQPPRIPPPPLIVLHIRNRNAITPSRKRRDRRFRRPPRDRIGTISLALSRDGEGETRDARLSPVRVVGVYAAGRSLFEVVRADGRPGRLLLVDAGRDAGGEGVFALVERGQAAG